MNERITKEIAIGRLKNNLEEGDIIFSYDDGWNAVEWHRGHLEDGRIKTKENYTWEGHDTARNRWNSSSYTPEEIKQITL